MTILLLLVATIISINVIITVMFLFNNIYFNEIIDAKTVPHLHKQILCLYICIYKFLLLSFSFYLRQSSKKVVFFKYSSDPLLWPTLEGIFPKSSFKTMFW